jgi:hypothetical protein
MTRPLTVLFPPLSVKAVTFAPAFVPSNSMSGAPTAGQDGWRQQGERIFPPEKCHL